MDRNDSCEKRDGPEFLKLPFFKELSKKSFELHAARPGISADEYFAVKHRQLQGELVGRKVIYLDTNHWINLRHVVLKSPLEKPAYEDVLSLLRKLRNTGRIFCPISFLLFMELMKQSDPNTRLSTAKLMDDLSGGICFQFPLEIGRIELRHFLLKSVRRQKQEVTAWVWTKIGFLGGEMLPEHPAMPKESTHVIQKAWIDLMWAIRLEHILEQVKSFPGMDFWERYAAASNADSAHYKSLKLSYAEILQREKALLIRKLLQEELETVGKDLWEAFPECRDPANINHPSHTDYSPWHFPSVQILAGISAADLITTKKFNCNDMLDFRHAALAIPYCDAVFCDSPMATRLRNKPCEFAKIYGATILGHPEEICDFLKKL